MALHLSLHVITDLNGCGFAYIPHAVFHILKDTEVQTCDMSNNDLKKIPAKFSKEFPKIKGKCVFDIECYACMDIAVP